MKRTTLSLASAVLLLAVGGSTGCDYFSNVVIPAFDFDPPMAIAGVYRDGDYVALSTNFNSSALSYKVTSLDDYYVPIGAGIDDGGLKKMTMQPRVTRVCKQGSVAQPQSLPQTPIVRTQVGSAGSTVSDGLWDGPVLRLRDHATCNPGFTIAAVEYSWDVTVQDFAGNTRSHGSARIYWTL